MIDWAWGREVGRKIVRQDLMKRHGLSRLDLISFRQCLHVLAGALNDGGCVYAPVPNSKWSTTSAHGPCLLCGKAKW